MKKIKDMTIYELQKSIDHNWNERERLERERARIDKILTQKLATRYDFKVKDIIIGKAKVFNKNRNILAQIYQVRKVFNYDQQRDIVEVVAYSPAMKEYNWDIKKIRRAKVKEILEYKKRTKKWLKG